MRIGFKKLNEMYIACEWKSCDYAVNLIQEYHYHVKGHIPQLEVVSDEDGEESYKCLWLNCIFQTKDTGEITWHVKYHGFHAVLKAQGDDLAISRNLPACTLSSTECNTIPNIPTPLVCQWDSCNESCTGQIEFIQHVNYCHISFLQPKPKERIKCQWAECSLTTLKRSKLADHVKMHTGEKAAACSHCGQIFANTTKFVNHRLRQLPINEHSPQCSHCLVFLPNERLLKIHMRQHVHHYKCCFCDLTCSTPSILSAHIKYRHLPYKPFKCSTCSYVCKSQNDLTRHIMTHSENIFTCNQSGCNSKFRTEFSLARHFEKEHSQNPQLSKFACHLCTKTFSRGVKLTTHLCSVHNVTKPSGYSRFEYIREQDGYFRLQTTRLESLEVVEMSMKFVESELNTSAAECSEEDIDDPTPLDNIRSEEKGNKTIAIEVIDEEGKVITSNVVLSEVALPPEAKVVAIGV
ncbi:histone H4 transcription factor-like isoform X2 [Rhodnius prolixus]|uniref:histone H4 transcription factor-like isoform X2 n=1 Tax=Rhodnius prolixus TaxID=13249 RepID=UPI003D18B495